MLGSTGVDSVDDGVTKQARTRRWMERIARAIGEEWSHDRGGRVVTMSSGQENQAQDTCAIRTAVVGRASCLGGYCMSLHCIWDHDMAGPEG